MRKAASKKKVHDGIKMLQDRLDQLREQRRMVVSVVPRSIGGAGPELTGEIRAEITITLADRMEVVLYLPPSMAFKHMEMANGEMVADIQNRITTLSQSRQAKS